MKKILVSLVAMMFLVVPMAFGLSITDEYYVGSVDPGSPANEVDETGYITYLINLTTSGTFTDTTDNNRQYIRTSNFLPPNKLPAPIFEFKVDQNGNFEEDTDQVFTDMNYEYALGKYGNISHVWYIAGVSDFTLLGKIDQGLSHYSFFGKTEKVPEPATLLLFGAGIAGLALYRRKRS